MGETKHVFTDTASLNLIPVSPVAMQLSEVMTCYSPKKKHPDNSKQCSSHITVTNDRLPSGFYFIPPEVTWCVYVLEGVTTLTHSLHSFLILLSRP